MARGNILRPKLPPWVLRHESALRGAMERCPHLAACYLFGSVLRRPDFEDVDVAILGTSVRRGPSAGDLDVLVRRFESLFRRPADLHRLEELPDHLRHRIFREGVRLHLKNPLRAIRFEADTLTRFLDFKPTYDRLNGAIISRESPW